MGHRLDTVWLSGGVCLRSQRNVRAGRCYVAKMTFQRLRRSCGGGRYVEVDMSWRCLPRALQQKPGASTSTIGLWDRSFLRPARSTWHPLSIVIVANDGDMLLVYTVHTIYVEAVALVYWDLTCVSSLCGLWSGAQERPCCRI
jgi:hypothetical protein